MDQSQDIVLGAVVVVGLAQGYAIYQLLRFVRALQDEVKTIKQSLEELQYPTTQAVAIPIFPGPRELG